tara:strand:+ start:21046 stop:21918 length:873 start_codon:yes stop_codon:yes gene_type:complete
MDLPFDGAISEYFKSEAPKPLRKAIESGDKHDILQDSYPYDRWMKKSDYEERFKPLQVELVKFQRWVESTGQRIVVVFEGRDTAGKSGAIKRVSENMNPRGAHVVALSKPTDRERTQWYFQRYVAHMPAAGELTLMDRSWYNRAVVEQVFGFCTAQQRTDFFDQLPGFEKALVADGIHLIKLWFNVGRAEQLRRMLTRESHPLKQWKLSEIDVKGLSRWDAYTDAIAETFDRADFDFARWTVIRGDDKYRARISAMQRLLTAFEYDRKDPEAVGAPDPKVMDGADLWARA